MVHDSCPLGCIFPWFGRDGDLNSNFNDFWKLKNVDHGMGVRSSHKDTVKRLSASALLLPSSTVRLSIPAFAFLQNSRHVVVARETTIMKEITVWYKLDGQDQPACVELREDRSTISDFKCAVKQEWSNKLKRRGRRDTPRLCCCC
jgi:hypothetical protein